MRALQAPFWIAVAGLMVYLLHRFGVTFQLSMLVLAVLFSAHQFYAPLTQYRIDAPMNFFLFSGLALLEDGLIKKTSSKWTAFAAGLSLAYAGLCSQRAVPMVLLAVGLYALIPQDGKWGFERKSS